LKIYLSNFIGSAIDEQTVVLFMTFSLRTKPPFHEKFGCMAV